MFAASRSIAGSAYAIVQPRPSGTTCPAARSVMCDSGRNERKRSSSLKSTAWIPASKL